MKRLMLICLFIPGIAFSQDLNKSYIQGEKKYAEELLKTSKITYPGDQSIDMKYYKLDLALIYSTKLLKGKVTITAASLQSKLSTFFLDLNSVFTIDSVMLNNQKLVFSSADNKLNITLNRNYSLNEEFSVIVCYHGTPPSTGFGSFTFGQHNNQPAIYTLSEPYGSRDWWPCKDTPADKVDSSDVWITCDQSMIGVSNGTLVEVLTNTDGTKTYKWKNHYPIAQYLISLAIAGYTEYKTYFKYSPTDSMLVVHYVYPETFNNVKYYLDETVNMLKVFTEKFGTYPFLKEKYGHAQFGWGGGMEHQTITSMGAFYQDIISHELTHQWFGDKITCRDWHHIWLNEGFAEYGEAVYAEAKSGRQEYKNYINGEMSSALNAVGSIYVQDISSVNEIFNSARTYSKGAVVLHMLRGITGDSVFFNILRTYISDSALVYGTAVTDDFRAVAEKVYGSSLGYFFNEWIYEEGYPSYNMSWDSKDAGNNIYDITLNIKQTQSNLFLMPIQVKVSTNLGDTLLTLFNNSKNQIFNFSVKGAPAALNFDPENWILKSVSLTNISDNETGVLSFSLQQNFPNPFNPSTKIKFVIPSLRAGSTNSLQPVTLKVYDILGNEIAVLMNKELSAGEYEVNFEGKDKNGNTLPSGAYYYTLKIGEVSQTKKMMLLR